MHLASLPTTTTKRIILLEDNKELSSLFEFCINEWFKNASLLSVGNDAEALAEMARKQPDLLVLDWNHPDFTGHEILEKLAESHITCPILLISEFFEAHLKMFVDHGLKIGYLPKPFGIQEFWDALNQLVGPSDYPARQIRIKELFEFRR